MTPASNLCSKALCDVIQTVCRQEVRRKVRRIPSLLPFAEDLQQDCFIYAWEAVKRIQPRVPGAYARLRARRCLVDAPAYYLGWATKHGGQTEAREPLDLVLSVASPEPDWRWLDVPTMVAAVAAAHPVGANYLVAALRGANGPEIAQEYGVTRSAVNQRLQETTQYATEWVGRRAA